MSLPIIFLLNLRSLKLCSDAVSALLCTMVTGTHGDEEWVKSRLIDIE